MKKSRILLPLILLMILSMQQITAQTSQSSRNPPENEYGIEPEKLYLGKDVIAVLDAVTDEAIKAVEEAYETGFKAALLEAAPQAAYWEEVASGLKQDLDKKNDWQIINNGLWFGAGSLTMLGIYLGAKWIF